MKKIPKILFLLLHAGLFVCLNFFMINLRWMVLQNVVITLLIGPMIFAPLLYPAVYGRAWNYLQVLLFPVAGAVLFLGAVLLSWVKYDLGPFCMALYLLPVIAVLALNVTAFCCRESNLPFRLGIPAVAILLIVIFSFCMIAGRMFEQTFIVYMAVLAVVSAALAWVMSFRILTASDPKPVPVSEEKTTAAGPR